MKTNKIPVIVCAVLTVLFVIAAVLCFILPDPKPDAPVEVTQKIKLGYYDTDRYGRKEYELTGRIKNVSDSSIVLYSDQSIVLYFNDDDSMVDTVVFSEKVKTITLLPGDEYDLSTSDNLYTVTGSVSSVVKVNVIVDGVTYTVMSGSSLTMILFLVFLVLAVIFLTVTITSGKGIKKQAARAKSVEALLAQIGGGTVIRGVIGDKNESKKAAAKSAGWIVGGALSAIFLGAGVFRVYTGPGATDLILTDKFLYSINNDGAEIGANNLQLITRNEFPVSGVAVKKNTVEMTCADNIRSIKLFIDKKSTVTAEQVAEKLNDIFVNAVDPAPAGNVQAEAAPASDDPFASDGAVTAQTETKDAE